MGLADTGLVRRLDGLGRLCLPKSIRDEMDMPQGAPIGLFLDRRAGEIVLRKHEIACIFCGQVEGLEDRLGHKVCPSCVTALGDMARQAKPEGQTCARCRHLDRCSWLLQCKPDNQECTWDPSRFRPQGERGEIMTDADGLPAGVAL